jgi:hypothetical protein
MTNELLELSERINQPEPFGWDEAVSVGLQLRHLKELSQWAIGDLANRVSREYGENSIGKFAYAIGLEKKTVWEYMRVARKYEKSMRIDILSFRHHQIALRSDEPKRWLKQANDKNWSSNQLYKAIKERVDELPKTAHHHSWEYYRKCEICGTVEPIEPRNGLVQESPASHDHHPQYASSPVGRAFLAIRKQI